MGTHTHVAPEATYLSKLWRVLYQDDIPSQRCNWDKMSKYIHSQAFPHILASGPLSESRPTVFFMFFLLSVNDIFCHNSAMSVIAGRINCVARFAQDLIKKKKTSLLKPVSFTWPENQNEDRQCWWSKCCWEKGITATFEILNLIIILSLHFKTTKKYLNTLEIIYTIYVKLMQ